MVSGFRALLVASVALPAALAVSLAEFQPQASNLPPTCEAVYTADIPSCLPSDFSSAGCSTTCISALNALIPLVSKACAGVTGKNIVSAMLAKQATALLCPNSASSSSSSSASPQPQSSSSAPSSTPKSSASATSASPQSSSSDSSSQSTTIVWATNTVIPQASSVGSSIVFDTNTPSTVATSTHSRSSAAAATDVNQGGTPFSTQPGTGAGSTVHVSSILLTAAAGGALLLVAGFS